MGVFILKKDLLKDITSEIDCSTLPEVYYSKKITCKDGLIIEMAMKYPMIRSRLFKNCIKILKSIGDLGLYQHIQ